MFVMGMWKDPLTGLPERVVQFDRLTITMNPVTSPKALASTILALQLILGAHASAEAQSTLNLGFETTFSGTSNLDPQVPMPQPSGWLRTSVNSVMESLVLNNPESGFPTEGEKFLYLFSSNL